MNCNEFEEKLHLLVDPASPEVLRRAGEAHAVGCGRCRRLLELASGKDDVLDREGAQDLTAAILVRTSGRICDRLANPLCAWVDGTLSGGEAELLLQHLDRCPECEDTAAVLTDLRAMLPTLAEVAPDARFVRDVLEATVRAGRTAPERVPSLADRWSRLWNRPRIAQEIAYVAAMLLLLAAGVRGDLHGRSDSTDAGTTRARSISAASGLDQGIGIVSHLVSGLGDAVGGLTEWRPSRRPKLSARGIERSITRVDASAEWIARDARRAAVALIRLDMAEIRRALAECRDGIRSCWMRPEGTEPSAAPLRSADEARRPLDQRRLEEDQDHEHDALGHRP